MDTMTTLKKWQDDYFMMMKKVEEPMVRYAGKMAAPMAGGGRMWCAAEWCRSRPPSPSTSRPTGSTFATARHWWNGW